MKQQASPGTEQAPEVVVRWIYRAETQKHNLLSVIEVSSLTSAPPPASKMTLALRFHM